MTTYGNSGLDPSATNDAISRSAQESMREEALLFVIDFDGTVAPHDTVDALLERFAEPEWREVEERWARGEINSQQCMATQLGMVRTERPVMESFLRRATIDPSFAHFVEYVSPFALLAIVSDGLDYTIQQAMRMMEPPIPIFANALEFRSASLGISFPYADAACKVKSGVCKCAVTRTLDAGRGLPVILIGDGQSDRCLARAADYVFAKSSLRTFCEEEQIPHTPFETFHDVLSVVRQWNSIENEDSPGSLNVDCLDTP
ncbi:MAG: HAD-IB family phosphatase [Acidobacteriota bacterium]